MQNPAVSNSTQSNPSEKRSWNEPSITDEDARNTAKSGGAETSYNTNGPTS